MKLKHIIPAAAVCFAMGAAPAAFAGEKQAGATAKAYGEGVASAGRDGAVAGGMVGARGEVRANRDNRRDRRVERPSVNSATTYGSGAVYTDRRNASAAVTTGGAASGQGVQSAGSTVDAYAETTRDGSSADMYGDSVATSGERPRN
ncbi:MAG: hypothetical protein ACK41C_03470 [Phenylobacterium sp.]|jgi:hypothetical protein|uniref:hypothetical protein n=1 Tax=Phenylobacterium sp. TaxID=1871053 RepID=UPI0039196347